MIILDGKQIVLNKFPDGTLLIKERIQPYINNNCREARIVWHFESNEEMIAIMFLTRHLQSNGVAFVHLAMPYIPNARQDRVKTNEDVFTLKYFSEFINSLGFSSVTVLDPHSSVSEALINNLVVKNPKKYIDKAIFEIEASRNSAYAPITEKMNLKPKPFIAFYPDEGAMKRYSGLIQMDYAFGIKRRDWSSGNILSLDVAGATNKISGSDIIIVDDICSKGGTFYDSAKKLKELGANKIYLYVTHCESTIFKGKIFDSGLIEKVFTTNSIFNKKDMKTAEELGFKEMIEVFEYEKD